MQDSEGVYEVEIDDLVMIPTLWIPPNILKIIATEDVKHDGVPVCNFYTDELGSDANFYYINSRGNLIYKNMRMTVMNMSVGGTSLVINTEHQVVIEPLPEKVYATIKDKLCTLELYFEDGILKQVKSNV
jgi:hypothetical protein